VITKEALTRQLDLALKRTPAQQAAKQASEASGSGGRLTAARPPKPLKDPGPSPRELAARPVAEGAAELLAQRERLLERFAVMQSDLGGAFYEMAVRDHVRIDVLTAKAAELQRVDTELAQLDRRLELQRTGAVGTCANCKTPYGPGASFCSSCGSALATTNGNV
jgi:hypothetical protein